MKLISHPNVDRPDDVYQWLVEAQDGLSRDESARFGARLILTLANHIGDESVIREAIDLAASPDAVRAGLPQC